MLVSTSLSRFFHFAHPLTCLRFMFYISPCHRHFVCTLSICAALCATPKQYTVCAHTILNTIMWWSEHDYYVFVAMNFFLAHFFFHFHALNYFVSCTIYHLRCVFSSSIVLFSSFFACIIFIMVSVYGLVCLVRLSVILILAIIVCFCVVALTCGMNYKKYIKMFATK